MIHSKKLAQLAKKWQRMVAVGGQQTAGTDGCCSTTSVADRGHCVMLHTADGSQFEVPLVYLGTMVFSELLRMSQEEFGFSSDGKITLPFDACVMEYVMCLIRRNASEEVDKAFLSSIARPCHSVSCVASVTLNQQFAVCS